MHARRTRRAKAGAEEMGRGARRRQGEEGRGVTEGVEVPDRAASPHAEGRQPRGALAKGLRKTASPEARNGGRLAVR